MGLLLALLVLPAGAEAPGEPAAWRLGGDWTPAGVAAIAAALDDQGSGTGAGEFDGVIRPPLAPWAGRDGVRWGWLASLGLSATREASWTSEDARTWSVGALRPGLDLRRRLPPGPAPALWWETGIYAVVPWVADRAQGYTEDEAAAAAEDARALRRELWGAGLRTGIAAEAELAPGLLVGVRASWVVHQGGWIASSDAAWNLRAWGEGALRLVVVPGGAGR